MAEHEPKTKQRDAVRMTEDEVRSFLGERRSMTMSTIGPDGAIHSVAMWYGIVDGVVAIVSKRKAQKVRNVQRDPRLTCLVDAGEGYADLRGVALIGRARIEEEPRAVEAVARSIFERYDDGHGTFDPAASARNRVAVFCEPGRIVSWDHRKLTALPERLLHAAPASTDGA